MKMQSLRNPLARIKTSLTSSDYSHTSQSHVIPINHSDAIEIMSCTRRRLAIEFLADQPTDEKVTISDLSEHVAARENDCTVRELSSKQRERVYISLYQTHLITMDSIIEYDRDRGTIAPTKAPERLWAAYEDFCTRLDG
jgi:hypothetical protein